MCAGSACARLAGQDWCAHRRKMATCASAACDSVSDAPGPLFFSRQAARCANLCTRVYGIKVVPKTGALTLTPAAALKSESCKAESPACGVGMHTRLRDQYWLAYALPRRVRTHLICLHTPLASLPVTRTSPECSTRHTPGVFTNLAQRQKPCSA